MSLQPASATACLLSVFWEATGSPRGSAEHTAFLTVKLQYKHLIREKRRAYTAMQWDTVAAGGISSVAAHRKIAHLTGRGQRAAPPHNVDGQTKPETIAELFATHFSAVSAIKDPERQAAAVFEYETLLAAALPPQGNFGISPTQLQDLCLHRLKVNVATGFASSF